MRLRNPRRARVPHRINADVLLIKKMMIIRTALLAATLCVPLRAGLIYLREADAVDRCLDMGGSFNYETMTCDFQKSHPYVPFNQRHPKLFTTSGIWLMTGMVLFVGSIMIGRDKRKQNNRSHDIVA